MSVKNLKFQLKEQLKLDEYFVFVWIYPWGVNGKHAFLAKAYPLQCHPTAKYCNPCTEVSILLRVLASSSAAENHGSDTEVAQRLTLHL